MLRCGVVAFVRWDPFRDLVAIKHQMERLSSSDVQGWAPAVDLAETADAYIIKAELPGLTREQLRINIHGGKLTLHGRRDARVACEHYHQVERGHGEFSRTFALPASANSEGIAAELADGVLTVTVPKSEAVRPRQVVVS
jgi:HSP20 family protein